MQEFDIYFRGEILPDADPATVRREVAKLFKVQEDAVDRLFGGQPVRVKKAIDVDTASRYRALFRDAGALLQIVPSGEPAPPAVAPPASDDAGMSLAEPGAIIDHTPPPPPAEIDTSALSALPPNSGSLEDCKVDKAPRAIPDISHLQIVDS